MIIGGNNSFNQNSFNSQMNNNINKNNGYNPSQNNGKRDFGFKEDMNTYKHTNPSDQMAMYDKSIAMLHERLDKKLITIDEFNKQCEKIGKMKAASMKKNNKF
ncbi:MAG: hypothetical protein E7160_03455 [Firmicutes bacterium]|nr:hypothetical protein [Bacillota bacterium]